MTASLGVEALAIPSTNLQGAPAVIHPTLIWDAQAAILVDAGYPGQLPRIREAIEERGVRFGDLAKVIVTHHDQDHIGGLSSLQAELGAATPTGESRSSPGRARHRGATAS